MSQLPVPSTQNSNRVEPVLSQDRAITKRRVIRAFFALAVFSLAACTPTPPNETAVNESGTTVSSSALEQVPAELSIPHFADMKLSGTGFMLDPVLADNSAYTRYGIEYYSNELKISGIMNIPKGNGPFPLVLLNHGFIDPSVYTQGRGLKREQDYLARQGFAVLHSDYRGHALSDESPDIREVYDAGLEYSMDVLNAINAIRAADLPTVDATRVGMLGHSMGGGVTMNIGVAHPDMVNAIVLYAPVNADAWENFMRWRDMRDEGDRTRAALGTREENPKAWDLLSSKTYLDDISDPVLLFQGSNDKDVPKEWADGLAAELERLKKDFTYVEYQGEGHEFGPQWGDFMAKTSAFFKQHLQPASSTSSPTLPVIHADRVTKKPFGISINPQTSPVQPEKFSGFHTGTDYEALPNEDSSMMTVYAQCDGEVIYKNWVNGYGGVLIQSCTLNDEAVTVLYGHLSISSISISKGTTLKKGDVIGHLGKGFSEETDGERQHLHLSVHKGTAVELKGYVPRQNQLEQWLNAAEMFGDN